MHHQTPFIRFQLEVLVFGIRFCPQVAVILSLDVRDWFKTIVNSCYSLKLELLRAPLASSRVSSLLDPEFAKRHSAG